MDNYFETVDVVGHCISTIGRRGTNGLVSNVPTTREGFLSRERFTGGGIAARKTQAGMKSTRTRLRLVLVGPGH